MFDTAPVREGVPKNVVLITDGRTNDGGDEFLADQVDALKSSHDVKVWLSH